MKSLFFVLLILFSLIAARVDAFPEMIRHGYPNCITCHYSANGGGIVTPYGRTLSQEVLSTWHTEGEADFLWGLAKTPDWLNFGGDVRFVQTRLDTPRYVATRFITMQVDLEAAANIKQFGVVATLGKTDKDRPGNFAENFMSRRHFVTYHPKEELYFRGGRFQKAYGLNLPDHIISTKRGLNWDYGSETYNLEGAWISEKYDLFLTGVFGRPDKPELDRERGVAFRGGYNMGESYKTGLSYFYGNTDRAKRHVYGPYGMLGLTKHAFVLGEVALQNYSPKNSTTSLFGFAQYIRLDYEFIQGLHVYLTEDFLRTDFKDERTVSNSFGVGLQFFPRPHFEWTASYQKQRLMSLGKDYNDYLWIMFHYYP